MRFLACFTLVASTIVCGVLWSRWEGQDREPSLVVSNSSDLLQPFDRDDGAGVGIFGEQLASAFGSQPLT